MKHGHHLQHVTRCPIQTNIPSALGLKMARMGEAISADHRHIALMIVRRTGDDELARQGIATTRRGEPFDVG